MISAALPCALSHAGTSPDTIVASKVTPIVNANTGPSILNWIQYGKGNGNAFVAWTNMSTAQ